MFGLWWIFPRTARSSRINGFSRKRLTQTETYLSTKLNLSRRGSDKFKELTARFSHVVMINSIRILLAIVAYHDYEIWQMDVITAFLNGNIEEELYMMQPEGFIDPKNVGKVCKLQRSIYGLKQA